MLVEGTEEIILKDTTKYSVLGLQKTQFIQLFKQRTLPTNLCQWKIWCKESLILEVSKVQLLTLAECAAEPILMLAETQCKRFLLLAEKIHGKQFLMPLRTMVNDSRMYGSRNPLHQQKLQSKQNLVLLLRKTKIHGAITKKEGAILNGLSWI